ncbi:hypothetical protein A2768_01485 [Candidatus Roizmanbacteria bacterium RIFCSPHIGHO2_01_FULL_37_16]|nr:MAG: hypothetical protein A2768_01485 [Candidatus Roizmanbacteria bacterium RIFCSPHIGHO2_01_FULL_37_16]
MVYSKKPEHNPSNYLKAILEAMEYYNTYERLDIALWLYEGYKKAKVTTNATATLKALVLELISKWIQELEDLAILCLMFAGTDIKYKGRAIIESGKLPFETYAFVDNQKILKFYTVARKGLPKKAMAKIYAYKTSQQLLQEGAINKKEVPYFSSEIDKLYKTSSDNLNKIGNLYSARKKRGGRQNYGKLVETYFKTKHGFKIIHPTTTSKLLWNFDESDIALVSGVAHMRSGRKIMKLGLYKQFDDKEVNLLMERIKGWSQVINEIVGAQLRKLDNPNYLVPMIRRIKTDELIRTKRLKVGRNDPCPCESGIKFKKCCDRF